MWLSFQKNGTLWNGRKWLDKYIRIISESFFDIHRGRRFFRDVLFQLVFPTVTRITLAPLIVDLD